MFFRNAFDRVCGFGGKIFNAPGFIQNHSIRFKHIGIPYGVMGNIS